MILEELVEQIKGSVNIINVAKQNFEITPIKTKCFMKDPFVAEEEPSIILNEETQHYYSFGSGIGGDIIDFVMTFLEKPFYDSILYLLDFNKMEYNTEEIKHLMSDYNTSKELMFRINRDAAVFFYYVLRQNSDKTGMNYFSNKRHFTDEIMHKFGLGFAPNSWNALINYLGKRGYTEEQIKNSGLTTTNDSGKTMDKFRNRVIIPIFDMDGKVIAFGGRVLDDSKPKYLNSPDTILFDKSKNLYALNFAKNSKRKGFIACEGYMDAISMHQAGFDNAIASLGTAFTDRHAKLIKSLRDTVYLAYDSDGPGVDATIKAIKKLGEHGIQSYVINMAPYKDPDEFINVLGAEEYQKRIDEAIPSKIFLLKKISEKMRAMKDDKEQEKEYQKLQKELAFTLTSEIFGKTTEK